MSQPIADLFIALRAPTTPLEADFAKAAAAGDAMSTGVAEALARIDTSLGEMTTAVQSAATEFTAASDRIAASLSGVTADSASMASGVNASTGEVAAANGRMAASFEQGVAAAKAEVEQIVAAQTELATSAAETAALVAGDQGKLAEAYLSGATSAEAAAGRTAEAYSAMSAKIEADLTAVKVAEGEAATANDALAVSMSATADKSVIASATSSKSLMGVGAAAIGVAYESIKMAADFQTASNKLVTSGSETNATIAATRQGMLDLAGQVGVSAKQLADDVYPISSSGFQGAAALGALKAAEQGAAAEGANANDVAAALSATLRDYYPQAKSAADVTATSADIMSKFTATTASGQLTFQNMAGSLHTILPMAAALHVPLTDILGDLASMTVHSDTADHATQELANTLRSLMAPSQSMISELGGLGINSQKLTDDLSSKGLSGTLQEISQAILTKMGPAGKVMLTSLNQSAAASQDAAIEFKTLGPQAQALAKQFMDGQIGIKAYTASAKALGGQQGVLATQWLSAQEKATGFNTILKGGGNDVQNYEQALKLATGTANGLQTALLLTGENTGYVNNAIKTISGSTADASGNVKGWTEVQGTFNQKLKEAEASFGALAISIGDKLLPVATRMISTLADAATWLTKHKVIAEGLAYTITAVLAVAMGALTLKMLDLVTRPIRALPQAFSDFTGWVGRMTGKYTELSTAAGESATARETAETETATAADTAATRIEAAAARIETATATMATETETARDRIVLADTEIGSAATDTAALGSETAATRMQGAYQGMATEAETTRDRIVLADGETGAAATEKIAIESESAQLRAQAAYRGMATESELAMGRIVTADLASGDAALTDVAVTSEAAELRVATAYQAMATEAELASGRIVAADLTAGGAATGEAVAGEAGALGGAGAAAGGASGILGVLGPVGAVVGGTLAANSLTHGGLSNVVNKFTGGDAALAHSPHLLGGGPAPASAAPPPAPDYKRMLTIPPAVPGDKNDVRNLPTTVGNAYKVPPVPPAPPYKNMLAIPPATGNANDARNLPNTVDSLLKGVSAAVDANKPTMASKMKDAWNAFVNFSPEKLGNALGTATGYFATFLANIIPAISRGLNSASDALFNLLHDKVGPAIGNGLKSIVWPTDDFFKHGQATGSAVLNGITTALSPPQSFFDTGKKLGANILSTIGTALRPSDSFFQTGKDVGQGFWNGVSGFFSSLAGKIGDLVGGFIGGFKSHFKMSSPSLVMQDLGANAMQGMWNGVVLVWNNLINDVWKYPGYIANAFGNAGNLLVNAGSSIIGGLWNGMKDAWNTVSGWIGGLGNWISQHKGPVEADRALLVPHGNAIMLGLLDGLQSEMPALQAMADKIAATLQPKVGSAGIAPPALPNLPSLTWPITPAVTSPALPSLAGGGASAAAGTVAAAGGTSQTGPGSYAPSLISPAVAPAAGTTIINNYYNIAGNIWALDDLYRQLQTTAQQHGARNTGTGVASFGFGGTGR